MEQPHKITRLEVTGELSLRLTFNDGADRVVSFAPLVKKGGVYAPLSGKDYFKSVRIAPDGRYIEWPSGLDLCADALWLEGASARETA